MRIFPNTKCLSDKPSTLFINPGARIRGPELPPASNWISSNYSVLEGFPPLGLKQKTL